MADLARRVRRAAQYLPIDDQPCAQARAESQKHEMAQIIAPFPNSEMKFGQGAGVAVVLDENRQIRKLVRQSLFQPDAMPARQMRRIDQYAFGDLQRPAYRNADRERIAARSPRGFDRFLCQSYDSRKGLVERP